MGISAKILKDSISSHEKRLITWELVYHRYIHSEMMTHRVFSRNAASSRAIPLNSMLKMIWNDPAIPIHWGKNQSGMQAKEEVTGWKRSAAEFLWKLGGKVMCGVAWLMGKCNVHKQVVNRMLEPWCYIKVVLSGTEWDNFFSLRYHPDAQPEIQELARQMWELFTTSKPTELREGEWHLPYIDHEFIYESLEDTVNDKRTMHYKLGGEPISLEDAKKVSSSLCAQTSFRKGDDSIKKAKGIYDKLVISKPVHASPFEHQATPAKTNVVISGNFRGWKQLRQTIEGNVCKKFINPQV